MHLLERRYTAKLVGVDTYFLTLLRYMHLNPGKAHTGAHPAGYPWSSHRALLGLDVISWLTTDFASSLTRAQCVIAFTDAGGHEKCAFPRYSGALYSLTEK